MQCARYHPQYFPLSLPRFSPVPEEGFFRDYYPVLVITRKITPRLVAGQHLGLAGFLLLFWIWIVLIYAKGYVCHAQGLACIPG